jgi:hypothetical protein
MIVIVVPVARALVLATVTVFATVAVLATVAVFATVAVLATVVLATVTAVYIPGLVLLRSDEVHRPITGVVLAAVLAPISGVARRHVQVNRGRWSCLRHDQHGLRIHEWRGRIVADSNLTVYSWGHLSRQHDANVKVARTRKAGARE